MSWKQEVDIGLNVKPLHFNDMLLPMSSVNCILFIHTLGDITFGA